MALPNGKKAKTGSFLQAQKQKKQMLLMLMMSTTVLDQEILTPHWSNLKNIKSYIKESVHWGLIYYFDRLEES